MSPPREPDYPSQPDYPSSQLDQDAASIPEPAPGLRVVARDGKFLGTVIETSPSCFRVSRLGVRRFWLTRELVRAVANDAVHLHTHGFVLSRYSHRRCDATRA